MTVKLKKVGVDSYAGEYEGFLITVWRSTERFPGVSRGYWVQKTAPCWRGRVWGTSNSHFASLDPVTTRREIVADALRLIDRRCAEEKKRTVDTSWIDLATS